MSDLSREEQVWLAAFTAANTCNVQAANYALDEFNKRFPVADKVNAPQDKAIKDAMIYGTGLIRVTIDGKEEHVRYEDVYKSKGVYVTREMLIQALKNQFGVALLMPYDFSNFFKELGLPNE